MGQYTRSAQTTLTNSFQPTLLARVPSVVDDGQSAIDEIQAIIYGRSLQTRECSFPFVFIIELENEQ